MNSERRLSFDDFSRSHISREDCVYLGPSMKKQTVMSFFALVLIFQALLLQRAVGSATENPTYQEVTLEYLGSHVEEFCGKTIRTTGVVWFIASIYMFEEFWLSGQMPVVVRHSELLVPPANASIEVWGSVEYCGLEGGFFYLNAHSWRFVEEPAPEFHIYIMMLLFFAATSLSVAGVRRKTKCRQGSSSRAKC